MRILIIEDEAQIATRISRMVGQLLGHRLETIHICDAIDTGRSFLAQHTTDLLFLDLNLNGEDGFKVLETFAAGSFHTIIISAYREKALMAFEYGVIDFIAKPFTIERMALALERVSGSQCLEHSQVKFLAVKQRGTIQIVEVNQVCFIKGSGIYSELNLTDGSTLLHEKSLERLEHLLSGSFIRLHKSYLAAISQLSRLIIHPGSRYFMELRSGKLLPVGRTRYEQLKSLWM